MLLRRLAVLTLSLLALASGWQAPLAQAQPTQQPVAIVSLSPLDRLLQDTSYILRACNVPELGGLVNIMANQYSQGIDRSKPLGVSVTLDGQMPTAIVFMPMSDRDLFFTALAGMGIEPDSLGDGLFEIDANGQTIFAREAGGWMYVAQTEAALNNVPADPSALLGELPNKYDVAIRLNIQALPPSLRDMATQQMRIGFERTMAEQSGQTAEEQEAARKMGEAQIAQLEELMANTEQVILGWAIDATEQRTYIDAAAQFVAGSKYAEQSDSLKNLKSEYTAFRLPGASAYFRATSEITDPTDKEVTKASLRNSMTQMEGQLDDANIGEDSKELVTKLLKTILELTEKTIDEGTFDGASSISVADNTLRLLIGGRIADGRALENEIKELVADLPSGSTDASFEFDYETYKGVTLHRVTVPVKIADPGARKVFGNELLLTLGTADKAFMVALDPAGDASLKTAIDGMQAGNGVAATPFEGVLKLEQLLQFAQAVRPNPFVENAVRTIQQYAGKDKVQVMGSIIPRGGIYRLTVEEGVMRAVGAAAKAGANAGGGF